MSLSVETIKKEYKELQDNVVGGQYFQVCQEKAEQGVIDLVAKMPTLFEEIETLQAQVNGLVGALEAKAKEYDKRYEHSGAMPIAYVISDLQNLVASVEALGEG